MKACLFLFSVAVFVVVAAQGKNLQSCAECSLDIGGLIQYNGYQFEKHQVPSLDGRVSLNIYRIVNPAFANATKTPVILQHGLLDCGATWIMNGRIESLGFILADAGFDVWISNSRGNTYSPCTTDDCWKFSFDEMALYDLPTFVDFVLNTTGSAKVSWVGHSQGTTQAFAAFSTLPYMADKISLFVALAPVAMVNHQKSPLVSLLADLHTEKVFELFGVKDFLPSSPFIHTLAKLFCAPGDLFTPVCEDVIFALCGVDPELSHNLNASRIEIYTSHTPAGTSVQNMAHWAQNVRNKGFNMFDYGEQGNFIHYGQKTPPTYDLTKYNVPTAFFAGGQDYLADPTDFENLLQVIKQSLQVYVNIQDTYSHLDFVWAEDAHVKIYPQIVQLLKQHAPK